VPRTTTTKKPPKRPPGPPGPIAPRGNATDIYDTVLAWYNKLVEEVPTGACQPLLDATKKSPDAPSDTIAQAATAYATLYRGAAEGCLGQLAAAATDLAQARKLLAALDTDTTGNFAIDRTCQPQRLLVWAYEAYLDQTVAISCTPKP